MQFTKALQHTIAWKTGNILLSFCVNVLLVRIMGANASGDFFYALAILSFVTLLASCSMEAGITYYSNNNPANIAAITSFIVPVLLVQVLLSWLVLQHILVRIDTALGWLYIFSNLCITYAAALYYAKKWVLVVNLIICCINFLVALSLGILYLMFPGYISNDQPVIAATIYILGFFLQAVILFIVFIMRLKHNIHLIKIDPLLTRKIFAYSLVAFTSNILFFLVTRIDYYFVYKFCDDTALSNYVQVSRMGQLLVLVPGMMATVIFPYSSGRQEEDYLQRLQSLCRMLTLVFIPVTIIITATGYWVFPWVFGSGFNAMYLTFLWYLPGFYSLSMVTILAAYLAGKAMLRYNLVASLLALVLVIICDILLIPAFGIHGAAATSSIAYIICLLYLLRTYEKKLKAPIRDFFSVSKADLNVLVNYKQWWVKKSAVEV